MPTVLSNSSVTSFRNQGALKQLIVSHFSKMSSDAKPVADWACSTVDGLISHLRSSFLPLEFDYVAKTLIDREERTEQKYLSLKSKAKEEIDRLFSENVKLNGELRVKDNEINDVMKVNADFMAEFRVYEERVWEILELRKKGEEEKELLVSKNLKLTDELKMKQNEIAEYERKIRVYEKRCLDDFEVKRKAEEEKELLVSKNLELNHELKTRRNEIDAAMKVKTIAENEKERLDLENLKLIEELKKKKSEIDAVNSELESKFGVYEKQSFELKMKIEATVHANLKLNDELQRKQSEIDAMKRQNAEYKSKIRAFESKSLESDAKVSSSEKIAMETNWASESSRKFSEKESSKRKKEHNLHEIIEIDDDDDDDDDLESVSRSKRRQASNEKTELKYSSRLFKTCQNKSDQFFPNSKGQEKRSN